MEKKDIALLDVLIVVKGQPVDFKGGGSVWEEGGQGGGRSGTIK